MDSTNSTNYKKYVQASVSERFWAKTVSQNPSHTLAREMLAKARKEAAKAYDLWMKEVEASLPTP